MKVAWIGLGSMGLPTAIRIAEAGHEVKGFDVQPLAADATPGIELMASPAEAAAGCELLCLAVFSDVQLNEVLLGENGVLKDLDEGAVVAIFTTGAIETVREIAAAAPAGVSVLDACFSRLKSDVAAGTMVLLVGGESLALDKGRPVFDTFAREIVHVGDIGSGRAIKLVNNILFASHLQVAASALRLAEGLGLEPRATAKALTLCSGASEVLLHFAEQDAEKMLENTRHYMEKDVKAAAIAAEEHNVDLGALGTIVDVYRTS